MSDDTIRTLLMLGILSVTVSSKGLEAHSLPNSIATPIVTKNAAAILATAITESQDSALDRAEDSIASSRRLGFVTIVLAGVWLLFRKRKWHVLREHIDRLRVKRRSDIKPKIGDK